MLNQIRVVLICTSHPGNIGATARAMKNMGFSRLVLVAPKEFPSEIASSMAAGAADLLDRAEVVASIEEAIQDCNLVFATSSRNCSLPWPKYEARECANFLAEKLTENQNTEIAFLFGTERTGLTTEQLQLSTHHVQIPTSKEYCSLNLAQAVQIIMYEVFVSLRQNFNKLADNLGKTNKNGDISANIEEVNGFYTQLEEVMCKTKFLDLKKPKFLMAKLKKLFNRSLLTQSEINILRGFLTSVNKKLLK